MTKIDCAWMAALPALMLGLAGCGDSSEPRAPDETPPAPSQTPEQTSPAPADDAVWAHEASDAPADAAVRYGVLENGMGYAIMPNSTPSGVVSLRLVLNVGSLAESDSQRGLAHFIEHMTFNGTTNVPEGEMIPLLERYGLAFGPDTNAFTGHEVVGYQLDLPSAEEDVLKTGLFLLRETASEIVFDPEAIDRERGVIRGEMRFRDTPIMRYFNSYNRFIYPHSIVPDRDPIGTIEVIDNAPPEEFAAYYADFYVPERAVLVVTGDVEPDAVEAMISDGFDISVPNLDIERVEGFSTWVQPDDAAPDPDAGRFEAPTEPRFGYFHDPEVFTLINIDMAAPGASRPDTLAERRERLVAGLGNAILQRRLQSQINSGASPLSQASVSYTNDFEMADRAGVFAVTSPERWREGLALLENELRRAVEHGFSRSELNEQLANTRTGLRNAAEQARTRRTPQLADAIWSAWLSDRVFTDPRFALEWFESIDDDITLEEVEAAFRAMWTAGEPMVHVAVNEPVEDGSAAVRAVWEEAASEPVDAREDAGEIAFAYTDFGPAGEVVSHQSVEDLDVEQYIFANGVRLNVKQTDFQDNTIRVRVDFGAGDLTDQPVDAAGVILGAAFGGGGLEAHDRDELQRLLAGRSVGYGLGVGADSFFFANATTPEDFELQMQVLAAFMTAPGWREDGLNQFRSIAEELRRGQNAQAVQVATNRVSRMLRGGDPRWGFPTAEEMDAFTMDHAREMLAPALDSAPIEITIVGDVSPDRAVEVVAATFAALPERDADWPGYDENRQISFPDPVADPVVETFNGQPDQGMANIYWPTDDGIDVRRARALTMLGNVFRLKALERFREQEGATYSPIVSSLASDVFEGYGYLWVGLDVALDDVPRMYAIADELAAALVEGEIDEDELLRARQPALERLSQSREDNGWWLSGLSRSQFDPDRLDQIRSIRDDYLSITTDELVALAGEYMRPDRAYRVSIIPRGTDNVSDAPGDGEAGETP